MPSLLIRYATVVLPRQTLRTNVLVVDGKIAAIDAAEHSKADQVVDAHGLHLLPGVVDDQVHFREPGLTHKEDLAHASRACAKGGVTTFLEMPNTIPNAINQTLLNDKLARASRSSLVNYGFYIGATPHNLADLKSANRTPGIKIFIGSSTGDLLVDSQEALEAIFAETTLPLTAHCEDESTVRANADRLNGGNELSDHSKIRDHAAAEIATRRAIDLAKRHNHRFHVLHVSTANEVPLIAAEHGGLITAEVCPHHLLFNIEHYRTLGTLVQMNPSIKTAHDNKVLWEALLDNRIQVIATDHAPHTLEEKSQAYPNSPSGLPAVENSLALMLDRVNQGLCTLEQVVQWMCDAPARVWDIVDKGRIQVGYDADLVLVDLQKRDMIVNERQESKCRWSPWNGTTLQGWPVKTWVKGHQVFDDGQLATEAYGEEAVYDHQRGGYWATQAE